jgi:hypothetical protein
MRLMSEGFADIVRPQLEAQLEDRETLRGIAAATQQKTFSGSTYAVGVTDRRLLLQALDRKLQAKGAFVSVTLAEAADAELDGAGGGWWTATAAVLDATALTLKLKAAGGERYKLMMMQGGPSLFGGQEQADGVLALAEWLAAARTAP